MKKILGIISCNFFLSSTAFAQTGKDSDNVLLLYGVLPISLFIVGLILAIIYANKDEFEEKTALRALGWILAVLNALVGFCWLYLFVSGLLGYSETKGPMLLFLLAFTICAFMPIYIMYKADFSRNETKSQ